MKSNNTIATISFLLIAMFSICFYWFGIRPSNIRKSCITESKKLAQSVVENEIQLELKGFSITKKADYNDLRDESFKNCLLEKGLNQ